MPNDTTIKSLFDYAKGSPTGEFPRRPTVFATFVAHAPDSHPGGDTTADLVKYANGPLTLSSDQKKLAGEMKLWRNKENFTVLPGDDLGAQVKDVFYDVSDVTIVISVSDSGQATLQEKLRGTPIGHMPPFALDAVYDKGKYVENDSGGQLKSLSFTFGSVMA
jgi:hypothetical protein